MAESRKRRRQRRLYLKTGLIPPVELDDGEEYPERAVFREVLAPWSKGQITYDTWYDRPIDEAFRLANRIVDDAEKAHAAAEEAKRQR